MLRSPAIAIKYLGFLGALVAALLGLLGGAATCWTPSVGRIRRAMAEHQSQMVWFRRAYLVMCCLVYSSVLVRLSPPADMGGAAGPLDRGSRDRKDR